MQYRLFLQTIYLHRSESTDGFLLFPSESLVFTDDVLSGTQTFASPGSTFSHNRSFLIDDFATPTNSNPALKMVYDYAGFWNSHPF